MLPSSRRLPGKGGSAVKPARRILLMLARLGVGIVLLVYLAHSGIIDWHALSRLLTDWPFTLAAMALILLDMTLMALRLCWLFRPHGLRLNLGMSLQLTLLSLFFATFLPGSAGGDVAKLFYVTRENGARRTEVVTIVILDRVIGLFSLLVLPLIFAPLFPDVIRAVPTLRILLAFVAFLAFLLLIAFLACLFNQTMVTGLARRVPGLQSLKNIVGRVLGAVGTYRRRPGTLVAALGISLLANMCVIGATALAVLTVSQAGWATKMCLIIPIGHIVNSLPLTPGGLGVGETAFSALFELTGLRRGAEALLCWRIWTALVAILGLVFYLRGLRRRVFDVEVNEEEGRVEGALYDSVRTSEQIKFGLACQSRSAGHDLEHGQTVGVFSGVSCITFGIKGKTL